MPSSSSSSSSDDDDVSNVSKVKSLADQILAEFEKSVFDRHHDFLPEGCLENIITRNSIRAEFGITQETKESTKLIDFILEKGQKIFAISLMAGFHGEELQKAIKPFRRRSFGDSCLPVTTDDQEDLFKKSPWDRQSTFFFRVNQWRFLSPRFSRDDLYLKLHAGCILPFIDQHGDVKSGAFGDVYQIEIHESHFEIPVFTFEGNRSRVALKDIKPIPANNDQERRELDNIWEREVKAHIDMSEINHSNIIEFIAAVTRHNKRYLMFKWADGGNLREFWKENRKPQINEALVRDVITQLHGLADAIDTLHNYGGQTSSYRHGDVKPENILRVLTKHVSGDEVDVGILKIADMGLAKFHTVATEFRPPTSMKYTTMRYEPPEANPSAKSGRSRRQDIWSFGCVALEFIIWLLHGSDTLDEFNTKWLVGDGSDGMPTGQCAYFETEKGKNRTKTHKVHRVVTATMDALSKDPECESVESSAVKDLLSIIRTRLIVVELGVSTTLGLGGSLITPSTTPTVVGRASARDLCIALDNIIMKGENNPRYWFTGKSRANVRPLQIYRPVFEDTLFPPEKKNLPIRQAQLGVDRPVENIEIAVPSISVTQARKEVRQRLTFDQRNVSTIFRNLELTIDAAKTEYHPTGSVLCSQSLKAQIDKTEFPVDNRFARALFNEVGTEELFPNSDLSTKLCDKCSKFNMLEPYFHIVDTWAGLEANLETCAFCKMRFDVSTYLRKTNVTSLRFDRKGSMLQLNESHLPVMGISRGPGKGMKNEDYIQIGFPKLPPVASKLHFDIIRQFLSDCDQNHTKCQHPKVSRLPARLIEVGTIKEPVLRLFETTTADPLSYIALSHPWGSASPEHPHFCTFPEDLEEYKKNIPFDKLPATFKHAVITTRELGQNYLWIDSICILQGPEGDFPQEAIFMEDVFSSAYCVIAASSAKSQQDGFLNPRKESEFLKFGTDTHPLYIGKFVDNFKADVLEGPLSTRGWVFQERAIARRTIFFTNQQTYWECGEGVRCETLRKMQNQLVSFLGDPNFPSKISSDNSDRGERIRLYEDLYRQYSRLDFSHWADRPIAIAGLEKRLIRDLSAKGGFGVFDDERSFLQRSLLWQRGESVTSLTPIKFPPALALSVPSWSWMGYQGAIDYLDVPLGEVEWELPDNEIRAPWQRSNDSLGRIEEGRRTIALRATARDFQMSGNKEDDFEIFYDVEKSPSAKRKNLKCVLVGRRRMRSSFPLSQTIHYVLIIAPKLAEPSAGETIYVRVGVGYMIGKYVDWTSISLVFVQ